LAAAFPYRVKGAAIVVAVDTAALPLERLSPTRLLITRYAQAGKRTTLSL
jgi:hypothetical protein